MTTIKTPLPEKFDGNIISENLDGTRTVQMTKLESTINQLIDYLAELTEVVEGKQEVTGATGPIGEFNGFERDDKPLFKGLKQTLLGEIKELSDIWWIEDEDEKDYLSALTDVKAIINRLVP